MDKIQFQLQSMTKDIDMERYNIYLAEASRFIKLVEELSLQYYGEIMDYIQSEGSQLSKVIDQISNYGKRVSDSINSQKIMTTIRSKLPELPSTNLAEKYNTAIYNARESINTGLVKVLPTPVYHMASSAYKYWEFEENIRSAFETFVNFIKKDIKEQLRDIRDLITDVKKTRITVYDPKKGHFEMDIYLPLEMRSLTEVEELVNPLDNLRSIMPSSNPLPSWDDIWSHTVLPAFGAHASVRGDHFTTFDGQEFDFSGRCSYVLARDFGRNKFSVILNYMGRQNKKLIVMTSTKNVQVFPNGKVRVNGVESKLPYLSDEVTVYQSGDHVYIDGKGFSINSNAKTSSYDIDVSHWFHGRTGGLLGVHDNEKYNDMMTSDRQIISDANALAETWQVQEKCR